jgi:hypothetical protein
MGPGRHPFLSYLSHKAYFFPEPPSPINLPGEGESSDLRLPPQRLIQVRNQVFSALQAHREPEQ